MNIVPEIKAALARRGSTQRALAQAIGLSRQAMSNKMNGHSDFSLSELAAIARELGTTSVALVALAEQTELNGTDALADQEGCAVGPVDVTGWSEEEREALEEKDAHRASAGSESSRDYLALTVLLRQAVGEQITPEVFVDLSDRVLHASPAELRRWVEDPARLHPDLAGGVGSAGPSPQELLDHEQACDSCWSLDDARGHLCGDEDPATHRSSVEEVA